MGGVITVPPPTSILTWAGVEPSFSSSTLPLMMLRALSRMVASPSRRLDVNYQEIVHPGRLCDGGGCRPTIPAEEEARMNIHKNARTTPRSRGQIVERVL